MIFLMVGFLLMVRVSKYADLTLTLMVANFTIQKDAKKGEKILKPWHVGTHIREYSVRAIQ